MTNKTHQLFVPVVLALLLLLALILNTILIRFRPGLRRIPGPRLAAYSRLWNLKTAASGNAHESFQRLHKNYGKFVRTGPNHVAIADPSMIPVIYGTNNKYLKTSFYNLFGTPYAGKEMHSMFSTTDPRHHKGLKQAVANKFSLSAMKGFESQVNECTDIFASVMRDYADDNRIVDLGVWLQWYAFDVIGAITFNRRFGFMEERRDINDIIKGIDDGLRYGSICGQVPEFHPWLLGSDRLMNFLSKYFSVIADTNPVPKIVKMVEDAIAHYDNIGFKNSKTNNFLSLMRKDAEKSPDKMPHRDLMNHLINNLLAGSDTTGISLRAIFFYMIKNPRCYQKLVEEIQLADDEGRASKYITLAESSQMPYLQACIKEAMRLHPGVGFPLERIVPKEGLMVDEVLLPEGTIVGLNAWVIHHDKSIFGDDADDFRPERWTESNSEQLRAMEKSFLSFGAGTRTCIGKNISLMEMGMMVPRILRDFDVSWASEQETWDIKTFWFAKQSGLLVRFHPKVEGNVFKAL